MLLVGAGLAWIGMRYEGPYTWGSIVVFGLAAIVAGAHSIATQRHRTAQGYLRSEIVHQHTGLAAVLLGMTMLLPGLVLVVVGLVGIVGGGDALAGWSSSRPGPITIVVGVWAALGGLGLLISRWRYEGQSTHWWQRLPGQFIGLGTTIVGVALVVAGWGVTIRRDDARAMLESVAKWVAGLLGG